MKSDLDMLMHQHDLDAILVSGNGQHNPAMVYLTGGAHMSPELIKKRGAEPVLYCYPMERDEAAKTGLSVRSLANYPINELLPKTDGNLSKAMALRYKYILEESGIVSGRVGVFGHADIGASFSILNYLQQQFPQITLVGEVDDSLLQKAMFTKDFTEIDRIRKNGEISVEIIDKTIEFLTSQQVQNDILIKKDGSPVTIGEVKNRIDLWLTERGLENPLGGIFSIGRDAGIPHSAGNKDDIIQLGQPIVFDLYPCEKGGGYFHDMTRTWCLGYATDEFLSLYEDVEKVFNHICNSVKLNTHCKIYQDLACDMFEKMGHLTIRSDQKIESGYVHSLGHGVGLKIHERPWFGDSASEEDKLVPGVVFTIEPGLYYPERNMGVRLEDTLWVDPEGKINPLVEYPFSPVLTLKK